MGEKRFEAFVKECNQEEGRPSACLDITVAFCLLEEHKQSEEYLQFRIRELYDEEISEAADRRVCTLRLSQSHHEKIDKHTGKSVKIPQEDAKYGKEITVELNLLLTVNTATEEVEKVEIFDKFIVNKPISYYPDGVVVFEKE